MYLRGQHGIQRFLDTNASEAMNMSSTLAPQAAPTSRASNPQDSFLLFASVIVGLILLAYAFCLVQIFRMWILRLCCGRDYFQTATVVLVQEGNIFNLNPRQRRAALEAIFSETSKVCV